MREKLLLALCCFSALLASCTKEPDSGAGESELIPINISGDINQIHTKATAGGFVNGDQVGLFAVNYRDNNTTPGTLIEKGNQADNVKYLFNESAQKWEPVKSVYYKDINTNVDLYLYAPYQSDISNIGASTFEVKKDQSSEATSSSLGGYEASDFLWGKGENITPVESTVTIRMSHKLSAVQVTLAAKAGFAEGEFEGLSKSIIVTGTTRKATIDFTTGTATPLGGPQQDGIVMAPQDDGTWRAIVIPQSVTAGTRLFSITIDGVTYGFKHAADVEYAAGKQLNFTIYITKKSPSGEYELSLGGSQITDWTEDNNTHGGEARQYYVVNLTETGTLGKSIKAAKKNPDKIRNLKVTGKISSKDFYFMRDSMAILEAVNLKESVIIDITTFNRYGTATGNDVIPSEAFINKKSLTYFSFPEKVSFIGSLAFDYTTLSGTLIIPDDVEIIGMYAFRGTKITSVVFPDGLKEIQGSAFSNCYSLTGSLLLPSELTSIGDHAFRGCSFNGTLDLPDKLLSIGQFAFTDAGSFAGDLIIPERITSLEYSTFERTKFSGSLILNNLQQLNHYSFWDCGFSGELVIPEGIIEIQAICFNGCNFTSIIFPSTLKSINQSAFFGNGRLSGNLTLPEGLISIGTYAFEQCNNITGLQLPSTLRTIGVNAFKDNYNIRSIVSSAIEPPNVLSGAFDGVDKDNCTVEVPYESLKKYKTKSGWSDFKRIVANYNFSPSRDLIRALNAEYERTITLIAPSGCNWSIQSKPDWVDVEPASGSGKTDIKITLSSMARTSDKFEVNEGSFNSPSYKSYSGRSGQVVFKLEDKDCTCSIDVEQYDSDYADGEVMTLQTATMGTGIDIVFIGEGYDAKDIAKGTFSANSQSGQTHFFDLEPYKSYKDYFNVYAVVSMSNESGIGTVNTVVDTKFGSYLSQNRILTPEAEPCFQWAKKANPSMDLTKSLTIMLMNTSMNEGITMMYGDGSAIACCPVSAEAYPYDFRGIVQHEAGGHGFGKLGDEYIYHNAFIQNCNCNDGCDHPRSDNDLSSSFGYFKSLGWYKNLSMSGDMKRVPWAHLIYNENYSNYVDMFEGGYMHTRGMYRSEATSCMNNNIPYYSAISRQAIVEHIMRCSGGIFNLDDFYAKDKDDVGSMSAPRSAPRSPERDYGVNPNWSLGSEKGSVRFMGEHPDYSKIR